MASLHPHSTLSRFGHALHAMLVPVPRVCFPAALVTDLAYWQTAAMQWANFSAWLLVVGILFTVLAAVAGAIDFFGDRRMRPWRAAAVQALGNGAVLLFAIINALIHSRDAYTSVVPSGLILSALVVAILMVTAWMDGTLPYRRGVEAREEQWT